MENNPDKLFEYDKDSEFGLNQVILNEGNAPVTPYVSDTDVAKQEFKQKQELEAKEKENEANSTFFGDMSDAWSSERAAYNSINTLKYSMDKMTVKPDYTFDVTKPELQELIKDLPQEYKDDLDQSVSQVDFDLRLSQARKEMKARDIFDKSGIGGVTGSVGAMILDEGMLGATVATEGMASPFILALKAKRASRMAKYAAGFGVATATAAPLEALKAKELASFDMEDALIGTLMNGFLGAPLVKGLSITDDFIKGNSKAGDDLLRKEAEKVIYGDDSAGAARVGDSVIDDTEYMGEFNDGVEIDIGEADKRTGFVDKASISDGVRLSQSDNEVTRTLNAKLNENTVHGGQPSAGVLSPMHYEKITNKTKYLISKAYDEWYSTNSSSWTDKLNLVKKAKMWQQFNEEVAEAYRTGKPHKNGLVNEVISNIEKDFDHMLSEKKKYGVKGYEEVIKNGRYLPRKYSVDKVLNLTGKYDNGQIEDLLYEAILDTADDLADAAAQKVARSMSKALMRVFSTKALGMDLEVGKLLSETDLESFTDTLKAIDDNSSSGTKVFDKSLEEAINQYKNAKASKNTKKGKDAHAKHKIRMNENYSKVMRNGDTVSVSELLDNNIFSLYDSYARDSAGRIALAQHGIKSDSDFQKMLMEQSEFNVYDLGNKAKDISKRERKTLENSYKQILGKPLYDYDDPWIKGMQQARRYNFVRTMGQAGFAAISEMGNIVAAVGWRNMLSHVPALKQAMTRLANGDKADELANEIASFISIGDDPVLTRVVFGLNEEGLDIKATGGMLDKADVLSRYASKFVANGSGLAHVTATFQALAVRTLANKMLIVAGKAFDEATGTIDMSKVNKSYLKRLKTVIPNEDDIQKVLTELATKSESKGSFMMKNKLKKLNTDSWDEGTKNIFAQGLYRMTHRTVQRNFIGETNRYLADTEVGKILTQFRQFPIVAYEKVLLHSVNMADAQAISAATYGMLFGGLAYAAQTHLNSVGRSDRKKYLKERLSAENLGKASFQRAPFSSMLPGMIDSTLGLAGFNPQFTYRTTGMATNFFTGNPTIDLGNKIFESIRSVSSSARDDYDYSQKDLRNARSITAFNNMILMRNAFEAMGSALPEKSK